MVGGILHEHIAEVRWRNVETGKTGHSLRAEMVQWLDASKDNRAYVGDYLRDYVWVGTVHPEYSEPYIRTYANGEWNDNLLSLSEY